MGMMGMGRVVTTLAVLAAGCLVSGACNQGRPKPAAPDPHSPMYAQSSTAFIPNDKKQAPIPIKTVTDGTSGKSVVVAHSLPRHRGEPIAAEEAPTEAQLDAAAEAVEPALQDAEAAEALEAIRKAEAAMHTPQAEFERKARRGRILIPGNLVFETGKSTLVPGPDSDAVLEDVLDFLEKHPKVTLFRIEGHTDDVGNEAGNMALSGERALTIKRWLVDHGIERQRIIATGFGDTDPIADNARPSGRAQNRRVEFYVAAWEGTLLTKDPSAGGRIFGL